MLGLRATAMRRAAKTIPIPIPAPPRPMAAEPIPRFWETWTMAVAISEENPRLEAWAKVLRVAWVRIWDAWARFMAEKGVALEETPRGRAN